MTHDLKIEKNYWQNILTGTKRAEIRLNDRDYQLGEYLTFKAPVHQVGLEDNVPKRVFQITHIHSGLGLKEGYVCLSIVEIDRPLPEDPPTPTKEEG